MLSEPFVDEAGVDQGKDQIIEDDDQQNEIPDADLKRMYKGEKNDREDHGIARNIIERKDDVHQRWDIVFQAVEFPDLIEGFLSQERGREIEINEFHAQVIDGPALFPVQMV